ncbi:unnamed protein product [Spirodela intermedia]|uniref:non-specific serine/threonine protein kinase n=1 Tax=Spirodela intermedia TaxID=51605 RepID=A0A7I8JFI6_SPIIN|nr:unnamed protein product [Spirodela intermedia]CAA6668920.1 unnamed protein product [Spirodela intermedia]
MSDSGTSLNSHLSRRTPLLGLKIWVLIGVGSASSSSRRKLRASGKPPNTRIPAIPEEIKEVRVDSAAHERIILDADRKFNEEASQLGSSRFGSFYHADNGFAEEWRFSGAAIDAGEQSLSHPPQAGPLAGLPELSFLGWGHWFTLRDLENATRRFSRDNVLGEGGYGVVYRGELINGTPVAVKKLLNNLGQAEKEFRAEVEAIGHVRHKNLVRLLGYCVEGTQRMLVYEYVKNGNLEQWLRGPMRQHGFLTWDARIKILLDTAKALAYLHEAIEPKVVHRDIKSSNILIDDEFNGKVSDFGLAKLLGAGKSHVTTRVMGTFGYVAPEYANTGLLNEKSDVYSFGVVLLEAITGRDPVDYGRPANEVNLVEWLKLMVGNRRSEEVLDPAMATQPSTRSLKRALLAVLRCVDPDAEKRPKMSQVVRMLEPMARSRDRRRRSRRPGNAESESLKGISDTEMSDSSEACNQ